MVTSRSVVQPLLILLALAGSCAAPLEDPDRFTGGGDPDGGDGVGACPPGTDVEATILAAKCGGSVCHDADMPAGALDLVSPDVAARVSGVEASPACTGNILAVPGDASTSLLYLKLGSSPPCGSPMPLGGTALSADEQACINDWIEAL